MSATNKTKNFGLPIYVANDRYDVLADGNAAMQKIDEELGGAISVSKAASRDATSALQAANDALEDSKTAKTQTSAALNEASLAKGESARALEKATKAMSSAETAGTTSREASLVASNAQDKATAAQAASQAASTRADEAAKSSSSALQTVASLSDSINKATAAGDAAKTVRTRYKEIPWAVGDTTITLTQDQERPLFGGNIDLTANDVITVVAQLRHDARAIHDLQWGIRVTGPDGGIQKNWQAPTGGGWEGAYIWSQVTGLFQANIAGTYTVEVIGLGPSDKKTLMKRDSCNIKIH